MDTLFTGIIMGFALAAPIGPVNIETIKRGFKSGLWSSVVFGAGAIMGDVIYCCLLLLGLVPFLAGIPGLQKVLWGAGALVMAYLGWEGIKDFRRQKEIELDESRETGKQVNGFALGIAMAVINPYALMWYITAGGAYVSTGVGNGGLMGGIVSIASFLLGVSIWLFLLVFSIHWARKLVTPAVMGMISGLSGLALWGFAVWFAMNFIGA